jgi:endonuclease YncB( thermonuclease family)
MPAKWLLSLLLAAMCLTACAQPHITRDITQREFAVVRIIDGDTFVVRYDGELTSVRIWGIDTPERGEPGYQEATDKLRTEIGGQRVRLAFPGKRKRDNFGRLLCEYVVVLGQR